MRRWQLIISKNEIFILPALGIIKNFPGYKYYLAFAWICFKFSVGLSREDFKIFMKRREKTRGKFSNHDRGSTTGSAV